ncbi:MAG: spore cortex biosynthesis protein YabQ [Bacillota bacterium]|nr:spore cortex biosynthesis protein YabQ [Bacillota bacterium]
MAAEGLSFVVAALTGSLLAGVGDLLWWARRRFYGRQTHTAALVVLFPLAWLILALGLYFSTEGELRSPFFLGAFLGGWLYRAWASPVHRRFLSYRKGKG